MVNYNMGRYYAWANLFNLIKSTLRKYSSAPTYKFTYIPPKQSPLPIIVPFNEWKGSKDDNSFRQGARLEYFLG